MDQSTMQNNVMQCIFIIYFLRIFIIKHNIIRKLLDGALDRQFRAIILLLFYSYIIIHIILFC